MGSQKFHRIQNHEPQKQLINGISSNLRTCSLKDTIKKMKGKLHTLKVLDSTHTKKELYLEYVKKQQTS